MVPKYVPVWYSYLETPKVKTCFFRRHFGRTMLVRVGCRVVYRVGCRVGCRVGYGIILEGRKGTWGLGKGSGTSMLFFLGICFGSGTLKSI